MVLLMSETLYEGLFSSWSGRNAVGFWLSFPPSPKSVV